MPGAAIAARDAGPERGETLPYRWKWGAAATAAGGSSAKACGRQPQCRQPRSLLAPATKAADHAKCDRMGGPPAQRPPWAAERTAGMPRASPASEARPPQSDRGQDARESGRPRAGGPDTC